MSLANKTSWGARQVVAVLLKGADSEGRGLPHVGCHVCVGVANGVEGGLDKVAQGAGASAGLGVAVLDAGKLEQLLDGGRADQAGAARSRDKARQGGAAFAADLCRDGVRLAKDVAPVAEADRDDAQLGKDDGAADGSGDLLRALHAQADVSNRVADNDECLEAGSLAGLGLLLHGHDLDDLVGQLGEKVVDDLELLDGD